MSLPLSSITIFTFILRFLPHAPNFAPVTALFLVTGLRSKSKSALLLPIASCLLTDLILGFYSIQLWVYVSYLIIFLLGKIHNSQISISNLLLVSVTSSLVFFFITNLGVWATGTLYPLTAAGLADCFRQALPFFRNSLISDLLFVFTFSCLTYPNLVPSLRNKLLPRLLRNQSR